MRSGANCTAANQWTTCESVMNSSLQVRVLLFIILIGSMNQRKSGNHRPQPRRHLRPGARLPISQSGCAGDTVGFSRQRSTQESKQVSPAILCLVASAMCQQLRQIDGWGRGRAKYRSSARSGNPHLLQERRCSSMAELHRIRAAGRGDRSTVEPLRASLLRRGV
jgi:hypothetical protein